MAKPESAGQLEKELIALLPNLRAFARSLCGNAAQADDLVQEALVKAWKSQASFAPGSNLKAWIFTILRNAFISECRKRSREVQEQGDALASHLKVNGEQLGHMDILDLAKALDRLPVDQKEAVLLISAEGFSYEEAALMCGCAVGTMKSRVNRARAKLAELLGVSGPADFGPDHFPAARSVVTNS